MVKKELLIPIWDTDIVFDESIMFLRDKNGRAEAPLLFAPEEIISVTNTSKTIEYKEGVDWNFEDGKIVLTENSSIYCFSEEEMFPTIAEEGRTFPMPNGNVLYRAGTYFIFKQIAVTYKCKKGQWQGVKPQFIESRLPNTFKKLKGDEPMTIVLNGDSISFGADTSKHLNVSPFQPNFAEMFYETLVKHYGKHISFFNTSRGGMDAAWAIENVDDNINFYNPDLAIIGYGMNDFKTEPTIFYNQICEIINRIRLKNPNCEFVLIATILPNPKLTSKICPIYGYQKDFLPVLLKIQEELRGVAVANITEMHSYLLSKKRYFDMTSNNINHPNDFLYRMYAQYLCGMFIDC